MPENMKLNYKNKEAVMKRYDLTYSSYDELYGNEQFKKYENSFLKIFSKVTKENLIILVDIGCGTGLLLKFIEQKNLMKKFDELYYIGIDLSINSVKLAKEKNGKLIADFIVGDAEDPPIRLDAVDIAVSYTVIHHFNDPLKFIYTLLNKVKKKIVISILKKDELSQILNRINLVKKLTSRNFSYIKIIEEKDIIIIFESD